MSPPLLDNQLVPTPPPPPPPHLHHSQYPSQYYSDILIIDTLNQNNLVFHLHDQRCKNVVLWTIITRDVMTVALIIVMYQPKLMCQHVIMYPVSCIKHGQYVSCIPYQT